MSRLIKIASGEDFQDPREPKLRVGDVVYLNSGSPPMLVVDVIGRRLTVAWRAPSGIEEAELPRPCVHRARDLW